jgi:hypothetical protein
VFDRERFGQTHPAIQRRLVRRSVQTLRPHVELGAQHIDLVLDAITIGHRRLQLPGGLWLHNDTHLVVITTRSE